MNRYRVHYIERLQAWAEAYADSESEAIAKVRQGEMIEGTQDSDPLGHDFRRARVELLTGDAGEG